MIRRILNVLVSLAIMTAVSYATAQPNLKETPRDQFTLDARALRVGAGIGFHHDFTVVPRLELGLGLRINPNHELYEYWLQNPDLMISRSWNKDDGIFIPRIRQPQRQLWQDLYPDNNWIIDRWPTRGTGPVIELPLWNNNCCYNCFCNSFE